MFRCKKKGFVRIAILAIFLLTFLSGLFSQGKRVKVAVEETDIYLEPSVNSLVLGTVKKGDMLTLLSQTMVKMEWYYVLFTSEKGIKKSGYIRATFIDLVELVPKVVEKEEKKEPDEKKDQAIEKVGQKIRVIIERANIRLKPDQKSQIIDQVSAGVVLQSKGKTEDWYQVDLPPDKDGIAISGYIHKSSVQEMKEEMKEAARIEEEVDGEESEVQPFIEPKPYVPVKPEPQKESEEIPWPEKKGCVSVKAGARYFYPSEKRCRDVYGGGVMYRSEISFSIWENLSLWIGGGYFSRKGELFFTREATELQIIPVGAGVRYTIFKSRINVYSGAGLNYYQFKETNPLGDVSKGGLGFLGEIGAFVLLGEGLIFDLSMDYSYCRMKPATRSINIGGFEMGAGIGYRF